ncbi:OmpA family protein [Vibrio agarivorans]|uniref:OmpA family protein n=1 Tax=Vibrio agarivorans TaxID=153622 RepID=UPI0022303266|nr:OmpA family protein [Vibrio agarivorans]
MKKLAVAISAAVVLSAQPAFADFYIGAKAGKSWLDKACTSFTKNCDDESNHFGGFVGYDFLDYVALELGYDDLGKHTVPFLDDERVSAWTLAPKFTYHFNDLWGIYAKVGGAYVDIGNDENDWSYLGAAGLELTPHPKVAVRLEYQTLTDLSYEVIRAQGNSATLGVLYKFGASEPAVVAPPPEPEQLPEPEPEVQTMKHQTAKMGEETFALNSAELTEAAQSDLDKLAAFLNKYPQSNVELVGHTDSSGSDEYNQQLSEKRANAVADALVERGISEDRITARGVGESELEYDESTPEGRKKNRFVEIIVPEFEYQVEE